MLSSLPSAKTNTFTQKKMDEPKVSEWISLFANARADVGVAVEYSGMTRQPLQSEVRRQETGCWGWHSLIFYSD